MLAGWSGGSSGRRALPRCCAQRRGDRRSGQTHGGRSAPIVVYCRDCRADVLNALQFEISSTSGTLGGTQVRTQMCTLAAGTSLGYSVSFCGTTEQSARIDSGAILPHRSTAGIAQWPGRRATIKRDASARNPCKQTTTGDTCLQLVRYSGQRAIEQSRAERAAANRFRSRHAARQLAHTLDDLFLRHETRHATKGIPHATYCTPNKQTGTLFAISSCSA